MERADCAIGAKKPDNPVCREVCESCITWKNMQKVEAYFPERARRLTTEELRRLHEAVGGDR